MSWMSWEDMINWYQLVKSNAVAWCRLYLLVADSECGFAFRIWRLRAPQFFGFFVAGANLLGPLPRAFVAKDPQVFASLKFRLTGKAINDDRWLLLWLIWHIMIIYRPSLLVDWTGTVIEPSGFPVSLSLQGLGGSAHQSGVQVATSLTAASAGSRCNEMSCHVAVNPALQPGRGE